MKKELAIIFILLTFSYGLGSSIAAEPQYPTRSIELIVGFAPGGGTDLGARMVVELSKKDLGQDIVVVNKPGGGGRTVATLISKTKPDGYTLGAVTDSIAILLPHLEAVSYKPIEDFTFITRYGLLNFGVVVLSDSPFHSFREIIEFARANPGKLTVGTAGAGTTNHVAFQALSKMEGLNINIVPFAGENQTGTALLGGHIMVMSTAATGYARYLRARKVRLLAVMSEKRMEDSPEVPTLKELGYELVFQSWFVIIGPKDIEKPIVKKLAEAFNKAMETTPFIQLAQSLESWTKEPLSGEGLRKEIIRRNAINEALFKKLGMGIRQ